MSHLMLEFYSVLILGLLSCLPRISTTPVSSYECGACMLLITQLEKEIANIDPKKTIEIGSFRVNEKGEQRGIEQISYARSQTHINDILESTCELAKEYKLVVNPLTGKKVFVHRDATYLKGDESSEIRSKLHSACNDLVDEHEDVIPKFLQVARSDPVKEYCQEELGVCSIVDVSSLPPNEIAEDNAGNQQSSMEDEL